MDVTKDESPSRKAGQDLMEEFCRRIHCNTLLHNSATPSCYVKQLPQWGGLDKIIYHQNLADHTLIVDIPQYFPSQQTTRIPTSQKGGRTSQ
jgi:hypothetical protein